ncbi:hypothetical protein CROQUDRAFT_86355 [Cronartium quercuum f. sp. fusiforme G11]|uniref:Uncharacterized protein n=1 Tax=Cronartium quercuum f. sp. fusiforme G11 TaxID=708437 RepID=A0A9P6NYH1_9BASI|nr:hypothetical protein CROQUDRAFT_86355 [Cronartium quercuum f. sp. fusiforme G11]
MASPTQTGPGRGWIGSQPRRTPSGSIFSGNLVKVQEATYRLPFPSLSTTEEAEALARNPEHHTRTKDIDAR